MDLARFNPADYIAPWAAVKATPISKRRLDKAIADGEIRTATSGLNRVKIFLPDLLRLLEGKPAPTE